MTDDRRSQQRLQVHSSAWQVVSELSCQRTDLSAKRPVTTKFIAVELHWARFNVPPNTLWVILETGFYRSNDLTNSVKAMKKDRF